MKTRYPGCTWAFWGAPGLWGGTGLGQEEKRPPSPGAARRLLKRSGVKVGGGWALVSSPENTTRLRGPQGISGATELQGQVDVSRAGNAGPQGVMARGWGKRPGPRALTTLGVQGGESMTEKKNQRSLSQRHQRRCQTGWGSCQCPSSLPRRGLPKLGYNLCHPFVPQALPCPRYMHSPPSGAPPVQGWPLQCKPHVRPAGKPRSQLLPTL